MRFSLKTKVYSNFGDKLNNNTDGNIFQTAARSFLQKTKTLLAPSQLDKAMTIVEIEEITKQYESTDKNLVLLGKDIQQVYKILMNKETIIEV